MRVSESESYFMPVSFGPIRPHPKGTFDDVLRFVLTYESDRDAVAALLPEPFEPQDEARVSVVYARCRGVNFMAGGGYNLLGVNLAASFLGKTETIAGQFCLVLWENHMSPIIRGRELLGLPKLFAEIPDPVEAEDGWTVSAREDGAVLAGMAVSDLRELGAGELQDVERRAREPWLTWRYYPAVNGIGAALSYPQLVNNEADLTAAFECSGRVEFGDPGRVTNPATADILAGLHRLPVREYVGAVRTQGSSAHVRAMHRVLEC